MTTKLPKRKNQPTKMYVCPSLASLQKKRESQIQRAELLRTRERAIADSDGSRYQTSSFSASTPSRKLYKSVVNSTAKKGYRSDLRAEAVARASMIKRSQRERKVKERQNKPRGAKARKAAAQASS